MADFVRNAWYAACWSEELTGDPAARRILDEDVALYRTASGRAAAVEDCCPHRFAPLSFGSVEGENIVCGYHGMRFALDGTCTAIPGQRNVPSRARVRAFPVVEKHRLVWVWTGAAERADPNLVPDVHWIGDPGWTSVTGTMRYDCNWILLVDNLIDLSHTAFVHKSTIGTDDVATTEVTAVREGNIVTVTRLMNDTEPSVFYRRVGGFEGKIDRWHRIWLEPPSTVVIDAGGVPAGTGDRSRGIDTRVISMLTPVGDSAVDQLWAFSRDFRLDDAGVDDTIARSIDVTFNEDRAILAGQQRNAEARPDQGMLNNAADAGVVHARRIIDEFLAAERPQETGR